MEEESDRGWRLVRKRLGDLSPVLKAYALFQLTLAVGIVLAVIGVMSANDSLLIVGLVLGGLFLIDTAVVYPTLRARDDSKRPRPK
jgi:hypothetical protein